MPLQKLSQYFPDYHVHCRSTSRAPPPVLSLAISRRLGLQALKVEWAWQKKLAAKVVDKLDAVAPIGSAAASRTAKEKEDIALWQKISTHVNAKVLAYYRSYAKEEEARTREAAAYLARLGVTYSFQSKPKELSYIAQSRAAEHAFRL
eukprot:3434909-Rhodomonas_salina.1